MKLKISKHLNDRQMRKVKFASGAAVLFCISSFTQSYFLGEVDAQDNVISWDGTEKWKSEEEQTFPRGRIHYYSTNAGVCNR